MLGATATLVALCYAGTAQADVLTFDGNVCTTNGADLAACVDGRQINQSYGDTALVDVQYRAVASGLADSSNALRFWSGQYNNLTNVAYGSNSGTSIFFAPVAGYQVTLNSFSLGAWFNAERSSQYTIVNGLGQTLFSSGPLTIGTGNIASTFAVNLTSASGIGVVFGPEGFNVGIDNVDFTLSQITGGIPEPATWAFMILGFGAIGGALRSRRGRAIHRAIAA
jgi:hypothetical protein